jgi:hypothetical protein
MSTECNNCGNGGTTACTTEGHCDSTAFDSSCTDEGQGFPLSIAVGCAVPVYTAVEGVVAVWDGTQWLLDSDSSSVP